MLHSLPHILTKHHNHSHTVAKDHTLYFLTTNFLTVGARKLVGVYNTMSSEEQFDIARLTSPQVYRASTDLPPVHGFLPRTKYRAVRAPGVPGNGLSTLSSPRLADQASTGTFSSRTHQSKPKTKSRRLNEERSHLSSPLGIIKSNSSKTLPQKTRN